MTVQECPNCGADLEPTFPKYLPCPECGEIEEQFWLMDMDENDYKLLQYSIEHTGLIALVDEMCGGVIAYILPGNEQSLMAHLGVKEYAEGPWYGTD